MLSFSWISEKEAVVSNCMVHRDFHHRTCIEVGRGRKNVRFIPLDITPGGFRIQAMSKELFADLYAPMPDYPAAKAAEIYLSYARFTKSTKNALARLSEVARGKAPAHNTEDPASDGGIKEETVMPKSQHELKKTNERAAAAELAKAEKKKGDTSSGKPGKKATPGKAKTNPKPEDKKPRARQETAARMFQDLIMEGKLSDEQIFAKVQAKFGLSDDKKWYTNWYRHYLRRKKGLNPPDAK